MNPRRSTARPFLIRYGSTITPATPKRIAVMSHGVRLVLRPRRATTIHPDQMLTAARPKSAPRAYSRPVGFDICSNFDEMTTQFRDAIVRSRVLARIRLRGPLLTVR